MSELRVFHGLEEVPPDFGPCAITIGNFDGLHIGHRRIMLVHAAHEHAHALGASGFCQHVAPSMVGVVANLAPVNSHDDDWLAGAKQHKASRK